MYIGNESDIYLFISYNSLAYRCFKVFNFARTGYKSNKNFYCKPNITYCFNYLKWQIEFFEVVKIFEIKIIFRILK